MGKGGHEGWGVGDLGGHENKRNYSFDPNYFSAEWGHKRYANKTLHTAKNGE